MRSVAIGAVVLCIVELHAHGQKPARPTAEDLAAVRERIDRARDAAASAQTLAPAARDLLRTRIDAATTALNRYERLAKEAPATSRFSGLLFMVGAALIADDASGVGVADDVLVPLVALALIAERLLKRPIDDARLDRAWNDVVSSLMAVGQAARQVSLAASRSNAGATPGEWSRYPACNDQFERDRRICTRVATRACWASQMQRLAWCNAHNGETGKPPLVTR